MFQVYREENVGFDLFGGELVGVDEQQPLPLVPCQFRACQLEKEIHGLPAGKQSSMLGESSVWIQHLLQLGQRVNGQCARAMITEGLEKRSGSCR